MLLSLIILLVSLRPTLSLSLVPPVEGSEWVPDNPPHQFSTEQCAGGKVNANNFFVPKKPKLDFTDLAGTGNDTVCTNGVCAQRRYHNTYSSGVHQFGAFFTINSHSGGRVTIKQTVHERYGPAPYFTLSVGKRGKLYIRHGEHAFALHAGKVHRKRRLNIVHDVEERRLSLYINGGEIYRDMMVPSRGPFFDKIGACITDDGRPGGLSITWTDVQFWHK